MLKKIALALVAMVVVLGGTAACTTEADTVDKNMTKEAESFKVQRRVTFINGITDKEMLRIEGRCSYEAKGGTFYVICKNSDGKYVKHTLLRSDNVTAVIQQLEPNEVDPNHYTFVFRPQTLIPNVDVQTDNTKEPTGADSSAQ